MTLATPNGTEQARVPAALSPGDQVGDDRHDQDQRSRHPRAPGGRGSRSGWLMFWDRPASADATTKMTTAVCSICLRPYRSEIFPQIGVLAVDASR
ncbi:MAG: hypothetical protein MZU95_09330 [Desulfomicrobium escambiense]|nr:hypothetical protein [Desulfomicrobium escambiense]